MTRVRRFDSPFQPKTSTNRETARAGSDQLRQGLKGAEKRLLTDEATLEKAQREVRALAGKVLALNVKLSQAQGKPLPGIREELASAQRALGTAVAVVEVAATSVENSKKYLESFQTLVLQHESASDVALVSEGRLREFDVSAVDVTDAGSLTRDEQVRILGRPVQVSAEAATKWRYATRRGNGLGMNVDHVAVQPRSMPTALEWMKRNGIP